MNKKLKDYSKDVFKKNINTGQIKQLLPSAFIAPQPLRKDAFLQQIKQREKLQQHILQRSISYKEFIVTQIKYIRKITWCLSFIILMSAYIGTQFLNKNMLWFLAALLPFLAVCGVTECMRSESHGMAELELASRFSLKSILFARLIILGVIHFTLIFLLLLFINKNSNYQLSETIIYLMVPYFMTTFSGLWLSRKIHGKEASYACMGAAIMISMLQNILSYMQEMIYKADIFQLCQGNKNIV